MKYNIEYRAYIDYEVEADSLEVALDKAHDMYLSDERRINYAEPNFAEWYDDNDNLIGDCFVY